MHETKYACGDCLFLDKDDGEPYYCLMKELYHFRKEGDEICDRFELNAKEKRI
jgi:hypothetical protein